MATLEQDYTVVPGQLFACLSVVGPECPQKTDKFGIKIRGCFATNTEAAAHAKRLQKEDATFDIYVVDMYKWLLIPPDREQIEDTHYADEKLEEMMVAYRDNQAQGRKLFEERKRDAMAKPIPGAEEGEAGAFIKAGDENSKFYTKPDEPPLKHPAEVLEELKKEMPDTPVEELVKLADAKVQEEIEAVKARREAEAKAEEEKAAQEAKEREDEAREEAAGDEDAEVKEE
jgi:hypothetical protein